MAELDEIVTNALREYQEIWNKIYPDFEYSLSTTIKKYLSEIPPSIRKIAFKEAGIEDFYDLITLIENDNIRSSDEDFAECFPEIDLASYKKKQRLKWLSIYDELLEVWDLYTDAGQQPWKRTFQQISKKVGRPLSTVKNQWNKAYEKIYGEKVYTRNKVHHRGKAWECR